jgi:LytTR family transcriptional regulator, CO-responsive transcriptional regulator RcoM
MAQTIQHKLQQFDPGVVWLDANNIITAMNGVAAETLGDRTGRLIGEEVLQIHPEKGREKVRFLLDQAACPADSPPPMTMMINIPERVLLIKVAKMCGPGGGRVGTCMVFYDVTELAGEPVASDRDGKSAPGGLQFFKLPVYKNRQVLLVDLEKVACIKAEGHYSTLYTGDDSYLCNLALSDLESRIRLPHFVRVHRSHMVNMRFAKAFEKADDQCWLVLDRADGLRVPISRSKVATLKAILGLA